MKREQKIVMTPVIKNRIPSWDEYFMQIAIDVAQRVHCIWANIGCVIVRAKSNKPMVLSTGYNGPVRGRDHCDRNGYDKGCSNRAIGGAKKKNGFCVGSHAEMNAIVNATDNGVNLSQSTLYVTLSPCMECTKHILNSTGIEEVVYLELYSTRFIGKEKEALQAVNMFSRGKKAIRPFRGVVFAPDNDGIFSLKQF